MPKPKYYFFTFDGVIANEKTDPNVNPFFPRITSHQKIRNVDWLNTFIKKRCQAGDMIFILTENHNSKYPDFYLRKILGNNYAIYIKRIQYYPVDRTPGSIIKAIQDSFQAVQLDYQTLRFDVVLIAAKQDCVNAIIKEGGDGILVEKNSNAYIKLLEEVASISQLDPSSKEAQTFAMIKFIKKSQLSREQPSTAAASGVTERSPLVSQYGSAISRSPTTSFVTQSGSATDRSTSSASPFGSAISRSSTSSASPSGSALRRSSTSSAPPFSLGVRASTGGNAKFVQSNNDEFDDDNTNSQDRRCRWCCC